MIYLPLTSLPPDQVSAAIWALSRPDNQSLSTHYYCGWVTHPISGQHALELGETDTQPIHGQADTAIATFVAALRPIVGEAEADQLHVDLTAAKGSRITVIDYLPPSLAANVITRATAETNGWFPQEV